MFVWGLVEFIMDLDEGAHRQEGIDHMKWGIVGMFITMSVYGIITLLDNTFGLGVFSGLPPDTSAVQNMQGFGNAFIGGR